MQKVLRNAHQRQKTLEAEACQPKLTEQFYEREIQKRDHVVAMLYQQIGKIKSKIDQLKVEQAHVRHHSAQIGGQRGPQGKPGRKDAMVVEEARAVEIGRARASRDQGSRNTKKESPQKRIETALGDLEAKLKRFNKASNPNRVGGLKDLCISTLINQLGKRETQLSSMIEQASILEHTALESDLECNSLVTIGEIICEPKTPLDKAIHSSKLEDSGHSAYSKKMKQKNLKRIMAEMQNNELEGQAREDRCNRPLNH